MRRFYQFWLPERIFQTTSEKFTPASTTDVASLQDIAAHFPLPWSHYVRLMSVKTSEARTFYEAHALARYALEGLPNKVLAAEYKTVLPSEKTLVAEIDKTRSALEALRKDT